MRRVRSLRGVCRDARVCPWWLVHTFDNPLRRFVQKPERILDRIIRPGEHCLDLGCGFGYFTIPMARLVGPSGTVTAADLQPQMLAGVSRRAASSGLSARIRLHRVDESGIHFDGVFDSVLAFWMVHEALDEVITLRQIRDALKPGGRFLLVEPKGHVNGAAFGRTVELARGAGLIRLGAVRVALSRAVLMMRCT